MKTDALVGIQDMGAAGLTCSTCEMGSRGGAGIDIDVSLVPQRETGMTPYEIMLSESQERMLLVVKKGREAEVEQIFEKWDLHAVRIGEVTRMAILRVQGSRRGRGRDPEPRADRRGAGLRPADAGAPPTWPRCSSSISRALGTHQRSHRPRSGRCWPRRPSPASGGSTGSTTTWSGPTRLLLAGMGAAVVRVKGTPRALAMSVDGNGRYCLPRSVPGRDARRRRGGAQRRLRRRAADRRHQLPELRQPRAARDHVAVRPRPSTASARPAGRSTSRSRAATSASTTRPTDGRSIRRRCSVSSVCSRTPAGSSSASVHSATGRRSCCSATSRGELGGSEYLKVVHGLIRGEPPALDLGRRGSAPAAPCRLPLHAVCCSRRTTARTAAWPSRWPNAAFDTRGIGVEVTIPRAVAIDPSALERRGYPVRRIGLACGRLGRARADR